MSIEPKSTKSEKDQMDIYLEHLTDSELVKQHKEAFDELANASTESPNSEWHECCFAATFAYSQEMIRRGLSQVVTVN